MKKAVLLCAVSALTLCACTNAPSTSLSSLDAQLDSLADSLLVSTVAELSADSGMVMIVSTETGQVRAMSGKFGSRNWTEDDFHHSECSAMESIATWLASIETGKVNVTDTVDVGSGLLDVQGRKLKDHNWRMGGYGKLTYHEAFRNHSNIATYKAAEAAFGSGNLKALMNAYNEVGLKVVSTMPEAQTAFAETTIGYNATTTAWDIVTFFNAIANSGKLVTLTTSSDSTATQTMRIASSKSIKAVRAIIEDPKGMIRKSLPTTLSTGVMGFQTVLSENAGGSSDKSKLELCGYYPAEKPQYTVYLCVYVHEPNATTDLAKAYATILQRLQRP